MRKCGTIQSECMRKGKIRRESTIQMQVSLVVGAIYKSTTNYFKSLYLSSEIHPDKNQRPPADPVAYELSQFEIVRHDTGL